MKQTSKLQERLLSIKEQSKQRLTEQVCQKVTKQTPGETNKKYELNECSQPKKQASKQKQGIKPQTNSSCFFAFCLPFLMISQLEAFLRLAYWLSSFPTSLDSWLCLLVLDLVVVSFLITFFLIPLLLSQSHQMFQLV